MPPVNRAHTPVSPSIIPKNIPMQETFSRPAGERANRSEQKTYQPIRRFEMQLNWRKDWPEFLMALGWASIFILVWYVILSRWTY